MMIKTKDFQIPKKVEVDQATLTPTFGKFSAEPFERGFGTTVGNALRRVLLSSIPGAAVTSIKVEGVLHEFSTIPGVKEDVTDIILSVKNLRVKLHTDKAKTLYVQKKGAGVVKGSDIIHDADIEILTPDLVLATLEKDAGLDMELVVKPGRGYVPAERNKEEGAPIGVIPVDAIFTPIRKVNFHVENARVGRQTDYDRLIIEVWTDGSIVPDTAISQAARIFMDHLLIFTGPDREDVSIGGGEEDTERQEKEKIKRNLSKTIEEMELSVRATNCLKNADIRSISDLVQKSENEMLKTKNFGKKSLVEIKEMLESMGLKFGMRPEEIREYELAGHARSDKS
jgi:DNA-directed RNA polymerase subunit alpha